MYILVKSHTQCQVYTDLGRYQCGMIGFSLVYLLYNGNE